MLNDPSTKDTSIKRSKFAGPNGVRYREVPLYMYYVMVVVVIVVVIVIVIVIVIVVVFRETIA